MNGSLARLKKPHKSTSIKKEAWQSILHKAPKNCEPANSTRLESFHFNPHCASTTKKVSNCFPWLLNCLKGRDGLIDRDAGFKYRKNKFNKIKRMKIYKWISGKTTAPSGILCFSPLWTVSPSAGWNLYWRRESHPLVEAISRQQSRPVGPVSSCEVTAGLCAADRPLLVPGGFSDTCHLWIFVLVTSPAKFIFMEGFHLQSKIGQWHTIYGLK